MYDGKIYKRDKRSPIPKNKTVSRVMSANKAKNTKPEMLFRKHLSQNGIKGYRLHPRTVIGKPDICFISKKIAIFINGCYWHRCPKCDYPLPKNNVQFWVNKFSGNIERDKRKCKELSSLGWEVQTFWECEMANLNHSKKLRSLLKKIAK